MYDNTPAELPAVSPVEAMRLYFTRYVDFKGRSRRSEYWIAIIAVSVVGSLLGILFKNVPAISYIWTLATLLPNIAVTIRRLHDVGKSGWNYLWNLLPVIGQIILLVFCLKDGLPEENAWGKSPKYSA